MLRGGSGAPRGTPCPCSPCRQGRARPGSAPCQPGCSSCLHECSQPPRSPWTRSCEPRLGNSRGHRRGLFRSERDADADRIDVSELRVALRYWSVLTNPRGLHMSGGRRHRVDSLERRNAWSISRAPCGRPVGFPSAPHSLTVHPARRASRRLARSRSHLISACATSDSSIPFESLPFTQAEMADVGLAGHEGHRHLVPRYRRRRSVSMIIAIS